MTSPTDLNVTCISMKHQTPLPETTNDEMTNVQFLYRCLTKMAYLCRRTVEAAHIQRGSQISIRSIPTKYSV